MYFLTNYSCHQICGTPDQQVIKEYCIGLKTLSRSCKVNPLNLSLTVSIAGTYHGPLCNCVIISSVQFQTEVLFKKIMFTDGDS